MSVVVAERAEYNLTSRLQEMAQENFYRHAFLTKYHTFVTPEKLFDSLVERYEMDHPPDLTDEEFQEWKEKKLRPVQKRWEISYCRFRSPAYNVTEF